MNSEDLFDSFANVDDELLSRSIQNENHYRENKTMSGKNIFLKRVLPVAACAAVAVTAVLGIKNGIFSGTNPVNTQSSDVVSENIPSAELMKYTVVSPEIPEQVHITEDYNSTQANDYFNQNQNRITGNRTDFDFSHFFGETAVSFLSPDDGKNKVYSPVNVYIAFSMLASCTGGETRQQILNVLGAESEEDARNTAEKLLKGNYVNDGSRKSLVTNSVWTGEKYQLKENFLKDFSNNYYAPVFTGDPAQAEYSEALRKWLTEATGGLLENSAQELKFDPEMVLTLASTLYFSADWEAEFNPENNAEEIFHGTEADTKCEFMKQDGSGLYYAGNNFAAVTKTIGGGGNMYFILPDEGFSPEEVVVSPDFADLLFKPQSTKTGIKTSYSVIHLSVPKFDVASDTDLKENLRSLGVTDVFDCGKSDFSPVSDDSLFLSMIKHSARVSVDEKGITAAAYTVEMTCGASVPQDEVTVTLDRPFVFAITGDTGDVLFIGIVNQI